MKALVLAGGSDARLRPFSSSMPRQLIPVANRPVLEHVLLAVRDLGVTDVGIVVEGRVGQIATVIGDGGRLGLQVSYLRQDGPRGRAHCLTVARDFLGDDDAVVLFGDNLVPGGLAEIAAGFRRDRPAARLVVQRAARPQRFGAAEVDGAGRVRRLVAGPPRRRGGRALTGVYFLTPAIHGAVDANRPSHRTETELSESVRWLIDRGEPVDAGEYSGYWRDVGTVDDVLACNRYLLSTQDGHLAGDVDDASELGPRVVVEAGARVVRSRIDGPAIIGPGALVVDSHLGPDTSIGRGCVLRGARLTGSVVLDAARITGAPPLRDSIIGRGAAIGRDPREGGHRLLVADHARVDLAA